MYQVEVVRVRVERLGDLDADVEEAESVLQLLLGRDGLAPDGWRGLVVSGGVVGAWDGERAQGSVVRELSLPLFQVGAVEDGDERVLGQIDAREAILGVFSQGDQRCRLLSRHWAVELMFAPEVGLEGQSQPFVGFVDGGADVGVDDGEGRDLDVEVSTFKWPGIGIDLRHILAGGAVGEPEAVGDVSQSEGHIAHLEAALFPVRFEVFNLHEGQGVVADVSNGDVGSHGGRCGL